LIDKEQKVDDSTDRLHDSKETSREQSGVGSDNAERLEDGWRIVVYGVDATSILPEKEHASEEESPLDLSASREKLEGLPEALATGSFLSLDVLIHGIHFLLDIEIVIGQLANPAKVLDCLLPPSF